MLKTINSDRNLFIVFLIIFNILADQITKLIMRDVLTFQKPINVIDNYFQLIWVENKGAFLGMGSDMNETLRIILLLGLPVLVLGYVVYYIVKTKTLNRLSLTGFCCIIGGGIANIFDRIVFGEVTDFFFIRITDVIKTGIFNIADLSVTTGMVILLISSFSNRNKNKIPKKI